MKLTLHPFGGHRPACPKCRHGAGHEEAPACRHGGDVDALRFDCFRCGHAWASVTADAPERRHDAQGTIDFPDDDECDDVQDDAEDAR